MSRNFTVERLHHLELVNFTPKKMLDVGAHSGEFSTMFLKSFPTTTVYAIEPNTHTAIENSLIEALKNFKGEKANACRIYHELISDSIKEVNYYMNSDPLQSTGNSYYKEQTTHFMDCEVKKVKTATLDGMFCCSPHVDKFDFIKIDVQGAELDVLKGGKKVIDAADFVLLEMKILEYNNNSPTFQEVMAYMASINFVPYDVFELHYLKSLHLCEMDILFVKNDSPYLLRGILE